MAIDYNHVPLLNQLHWMVGNGNMRNEWFNGVIDEMKIYNRALTDEQIKAGSNC
ncbi:MAG: hypothetical protein GF398_02705 [Chitinivibrionales bacterium]|nr:hypothetical protein [Chitinivibrionales bacterium]